MRRAPYLAPMVGAFMLVVSSAWAGDKSNASGEEGLKKRAAEYMAAFEKGDPKTLAGFWTLDAVYVDQAGHTINGRDAIEKAFEKQFAAAKGAKLVITTASLRFVNDKLAIEDGTTELIYGNDAPPTAARYTAVHVKQDGQWYLADVRDAIFIPPSNHDNLGELGWLEGEWVGEAEKGEVARATYSWAENDNFLVSSFETTLKDVPVGGGTQWIGWDGAAKRIRSWSFNSNGGFVEGTWSRDGDKWLIKVNATPRDGKKVSATVVVTKVDDDHLTWQSTNRSMDGKAEPDSNVIKMKRAK
jgi:uncharacterized protein (TIGR02246 family)